jgi:uncharacterized protein (TIGR02466 family)
MKMKSKLLFATQIYQEKLNSQSFQLRSVIKDIRQESFQIQRIDALGIKWSKLNYPNGYTSYSSHDQLHKMSSTFTGLELQIQTHIQKYLKKLGYQTSVKTLKMTDCWVNIMTKNAVHTPHIHPHSVISGTVYIATPKGSSGIKFHDPRMQQFMNAPAPSPKAKTELQRYIELKPRAGDIVLFESWLTHEVPLNNSTEPRISVSFNYDWK